MRVLFGWSFQHFALYFFNFSQRQLVLPMKVIHSSMYKFYTVSYPHKKKEGISEALISMLSKRLQISHITFLCKQFTSTKTDKKATRQKDIHFNNWKIQYRVDEQKKDNLNVILWKRIMYITIWEILQVLARGIETFKSALRIKQVIPIATFL